MLPGQEVGAASALKRIGSSFVKRQNMILEWGSVSVRRNSSSLEAINSVGMRKILGAFSILPSKDTWLRCGKVERQTVSTERAWTSRTMILTETAVIFAQEGSDVVLDSLPLDNISFVGKVDRAQDACNNNAISRGLARNLASRRNLPVLDIVGGPEKPAKRGFRKLSTAMKMDSVTELQDHRNKFVMEIRVRATGCESTGGRGDSIGRDVSTSGVGSGGTSSNGGEGFAERSHFVRVGEAEDCDCWVHEIRAAVTRVQGKQRRERGWLFRMQRGAHRVYETPWWKGVVALAIFCDFASSVYEAEYLPPSNTTSGRSVVALTQVLNIFFILELIFTAFANWHTWWGSPFVDSSWNWYQTGTVAFQLATLNMPSYSPYIRIRMIRIFHVASMFKAFVSFKIIMTALRQAMIPVFSALVILVFVTCIAAVFAVHLFHTLDSWDFGNFSLAVFTMFQVASGDGWAAFIARPLIGNTYPNFYGSESESNSRWSQVTLVTSEVARRYESYRSLTPVFDSGFEVPDQLLGTNPAAAPSYASPSMRRTIALFFVFFYFMAGIGLLGIVHATLLDEFMNVVQKERKKFQIKELEVRYMTAEKLSSPLDPLLASLAHFNSMEDLSKKIQDIFRMLDSNGNGSLNYVEMQDGLERLSMPIKLSLEDLDSLTDNKALCNPAGELDAVGFERVLRKQLHLFVQRTLASSIEQIERLEPAPGSEQEHMGVILFVLKMLIASADEEGGGMTKSNDHAGTFRGKGGMLNRCVSEASFGRSDSQGDEMGRKLDEILTILQRWDGPPKQPQNQPLRDESDKPISAFSRSTPVLMLRKPRDRSDGRSIFRDLALLASAQVEWGLSKGKLPFESVSEKESTLDTEIDDRHAEWIPNPKSLDLDNSCVVDSSGVSTARANHRREKYLAHSEKVENSEDTGHAPSCTENLQPWGSGQRGRSYERVRKVSVDHPKHRCSPIPNGDSYKGRDSAGKVGVSSQGDQDLVDHAHQPRRSRRREDSKGHSIHDTQGEAKQNGRISSRGRRRDTSAENSCQRHSSNQHILYQGENVEAVHDEPSLTPSFEIESITTCAATERSLALGKRECEKLERASKPCSNARSRERGRLERKLSPESGQRREQSVVRVNISHACDVDQPALYISEEGTAAHQRGEDIRITGSIEWQRCPDSRGDRAKHRGRNLEHCSIHRPSNGSTSRGAKESENFDDITCSTFDSERKDSHPTTQDPEMLAASSPVEVCKKFAENSVDIVGYPSDDMGGLRRDIERARSKYTDMRRSPRKHRAASSGSFRRTIAVVNVGWSKSDSSLVNGGHGESAFEPRPEEPAGFVPLALTALEGNDGGSGARRATPSPQGPRMGQEEIRWRLSALQGANLLH